ncbi:nucleotide sugar dehydrogenase [Pelagibius sp. Alg239-R121]|uniref:nucleotide sugar dehydrogenase n=1 Tax=Pelagibius sp. Alg239-R121 TaxID=2993448 RepID=UPI0024A76161|nr:nucleotide sugar dehydrogenase [Pelagibius sp. Alg239-R121]
MLTSEKIAVIGLGYVGLPLAVAFAKHFETVIGIDIDSKRIAALRANEDWTGEVTSEHLAASSIRFTDSAADLEGATFFAITVPTPVDGDRRPDLGAVKGACRMIAPYLKSGGVVVLESTVFPGVTEDICGPILAEVSGLRQGVDFKLGYSPERINPGDTEHGLEAIVKVVSGEDAETLDRVSEAYGSFAAAGVHRAPSIKVAESAKVIENTQRDLNIALMNELAIIFERLEIPTRDVLAAAGTKWNFLKFTPGLVGGHCIGVDPYYLTARAEAVGYHPEVILAGRRINDGMGAFLARKLIKMLLASDRMSANARIGILGLTFKENVPDIRNSKVPDIVTELREFSLQPLIFDPYVSAELAEEEFGLALSPDDQLRDLDGLILAVSHQSFLDGGTERLTDRIKPGGILIDVKAVLDETTIRSDVQYWGL